MLKFSYNATTENIIAPEKKLCFRKPHGYHIYLHTASWDTAIYDRFTLRIKIIV
jgi:hypothetical protein